MFTYTSIHICINKMMPAFINKCYSYYVQQNSIGAQSVWAFYNS